MEKYDVKLAEGVVVRVNADNPEDAKAKAKAVIAKREGSKAYDKVFFDYETGIQNNSLRAQLAVAEDFTREDGEYVSEKENVLNRFPGIGSSGYVRDSKGSLALTPAAQAALGLKPSKKNIVIDENKAFTAGDFADLAGYAGPVFGAIASVNPYFRGIKWLRGALDSRVGRALLVGAGSGAGKALEESNEIARGVQLQNEEELAKMVKDEVVLGAAFQGGAEVLGGIFKTYFGKTASTGNVRDSRLLMDGYSLKDAFRIDSQMAIKKGIDDPNYKATLDEIYKEFKKQKIKPSFSRGIVSQATLGKTLVSRGQQISEAVTGATVREKKATANLVAQMDDFFKSIGNADATIDDFISAGAVGKIAGQELKTATTAFDKAMNLSDQRLDELLKKMVFEMNSVQELGEVSGSALKQQLKDSIEKSYNAFITQKTKLYNKSTVALKDSGAMPILQQHVRGYASVFGEIFKRAELEDVFAKYQGRPVTYLKELAEGGRLESLEQLHNARLEVKALITKMTNDGKVNGTGYRMMKEVSEEIDTLFKDLQSGKAFLGKNSKTLSQLEGREPDFLPGEEGFGTSPVVTSGDAVFSGMPELEMNAAMNAARALGKANQYYAQGMQKFDNAIAQRVINNIKLNKGRGNDSFGFTKTSHLEKGESAEDANNFLCEDSFSPSERLELTKKYDSDEKSWPDKNVIDKLKPYKIISGKFIPLEDETRKEVNGSIVYTSKEINFLTVASNLNWPETTIIKIQDEIIKNTKIEIAKLEMAKQDDPLISTALTNQNTSKRCENHQNIVSSEKESLLLLDQNLDISQACDLDNGDLVSSLTLEEKADIQLKDQVLNLDYANIASAEALNMISNAKHRVSTNISGHYQINELPRGEYLIISNYSDNFIEGIFLANTSIDADGIFDLSNTNYFSIPSFGYLVSKFYENCSENTCTREDFKNSLNLQNIADEYESYKAEREETAAEMRRLCRSLGLASCS